MTTTIDTTRQAELYAFSMTKLEEAFRNIEFLSREQIAAFGTRLNEMTDGARAYYRYAKSEPGSVAEPVVPAPAPQGEPLGYVTYVCPTCQYTWLGQDLSAAGTYETRECGVCLTKARQAPEQPVAEPVSEARNETIGDGTYTVEFEDGTYRTLRIKTQDLTSTFMPGKRIASYLNGPDNWSNYQGFAFVNDDNSYHVWKRHEGATTVINALAALLAGRESMIAGLKAYGHQSGKCGVCGKKLTTPDSIKLGIGPICAGNLGI